jgi:cell division protein FtsB
MQQIMFTDKPLRQLEQDVWRLWMQSVIYQAKNKNSFFQKYQMDNPDKKSITKNSILKKLSNKYVLVILLFGVWMLFLDNYSYLEHRLLDKEINELEDNEQYYRNEIKADQQKIKLLKNTDQVEKYAREKYFMKKDSEDIYIIEFEGDTVK